MGVCVPLPIGAYDGASFISVAFGDRVRSTHRWCNSALRSCTTPVGALPCGVYLWDTDPDLRLWGPCALGVDDLLLLPSTSTTINVYSETSPWLKEVGDGERDDG